jgi:aminoglycoside phosphotransferase (APT) family kinase protein
MGYEIPRVPTRATMRWVERTAGGRVVGTRRLVGGISSLVCRVSVEDRTGARRQLVLRRWLGAEVDDTRRFVEDEARALTAMAGTAVPAPELVSTSDGSETDGFPALLMTRVPGHVHLTPRDPDAWLRQIAMVLPHVHAIAIDAQPWEPALDEARPRPPWIAPKTWDAAQAVLAQPPPTPRESQYSFVHNDYQHFNVLWRRERLTGLVDWTFPCIGPSDVDVAHCRLNLAVLFSPEWAERFRLAYEAEAGRTVHPWVDLYRLTMFSLAWEDFIPIQVGGRAPVDIEGMPRRVEQAIADTLRRM